MPRILATEAIEYENTKMIPSIVITEKNENLCQTTRIPGTQGAFSEKVTTDIDDFTNELVVQCDVHVVKNTYK